MSTFKWSAGSGNWNTPMLWDGGSVPGSFDTAVIAATGANYAVAVIKADTLIVNNVTLSTSNATLEIDGGLTVNEQLRIAAGTVIANGNLTASGITDGGLLAYVGSHTLHNLLINIGGAAQGTLQVQDTSSGTPATLTLGADVVVQQTDALSATINSTAMKGETIVNQGHINAQLADASMTIAPLNFINQGTINAANREALTIGGNWSNATGIITVASDASLTLAGSFTTKGLGTIIGATSVNLTGMLNNAGTTLAVGRGSRVGTVNLEDTGIVSGGTITDIGGAAFTYAGNGTFNAVTYRGPLDISTPGARLSVTNGLSVMSSVSSGPGVINVNGGSNAAINFVNSQTIDNAAINLEGANLFGSPAEIDIGGISGSVLTLGSHLTVNSTVTNTRASIRGLSGQLQSAMVNKGTIAAAASGGSFNITQMNGFINQGTIAVSNGDMFSIQLGTGLFSNSGSVVVGSGSTLQILGIGTAAPISNTGTITLTSGATLDLGGFYTLPSLGKVQNTGVIQIDGTLDGQDGTIYLGPGTALGTVVLAGNIHNATIETNDAFNIHAPIASLRNDVIHGAIVIADDSSALTINEGVTFAGVTEGSPGSIDVTGKGDSLLFSNLTAGNGIGQTIDNVTMNIGNATVAASIAPNFAGGTFTIGQSASIVSAMAGARASLSATPGTGIVLNGTLSATGKGGLFTIPGVSGSSFTNNGTMIVGNGDTLSVTTAIAGGGGLGAIDIATGGIADFASAVAANQTVKFTGSSGVLKLRQPTSFAGTIAQYFVGDTIDLVGKTAKAAHWTAGAEGKAGTLTVANAGGTTVAALPVLGDYSDASFTVVGDSAGGTAVTTTLPCYAAGTRIMTTRGEVAVEHLREGDLVLTVSGMAQPIRWIGFRRVDIRHHPKSRNVEPIEIMANAFGDGRPRRKLVLSPDHAVLVENVLIPIRLLVNGSTVVGFKCDAVSYYHIELPCHDVVFAEGMPAESYLETGARGAFANRGGVMQLHPEFAPPSDRIAMLWEVSAYAPLVVAGEALERARRNLARQSAMLDSCRRQRMRKAA